MDEASRRILSHLIRSQRVASLGTLRKEAPFVSLVLYSFSADFSRFYFHASRLARHTRNLIEDPRVALMIAGADTAVEDPQQLPRISMVGDVDVVPTSADDYESARTTYLERFPSAQLHFQLGDFALYRIQPTGARYVAGFAQIFQLRPEDLQAASREDPAG